MPPRVHRHLDADVLAGARVGHAAGSDVLALGVLPDDDEVDPVGAAHAGRDTGKRDYGADVDREVQLLAEADDQAPHELVVGHVRAPYGPEQGGVVLADDLGTVSGHRGALTQVALAAPVELGHLERAGRSVAVPLEGGPHHRDRRRDHLGADAVAGDHREPYRHLPSSIGTGHWSDQ